MDVVSREDTGLAKPQTLTLVPAVHAHLAHRVELTLLKSGQTGQIYLIKTELYLE